MLLPSKELLTLIKQRNAPSININLFMAIHVERLFSHFDLF